jgi:hypothetical protein
VDLTREARRMGLLHFYPTTRKSTQQLILPSGFDEDMRAKIGGEDYVACCYITEDLADVGVYMLDIENKEEKGTSLASDFVRIILDALKENKTFMKELDDVIESKTGEAGKASDSR